MQWNSETSGISPTLKKIARALLPIGQLPFSHLIPDGVFGRIGLELSECAQETWDDLRRNMSAVLDELPRSYQETCANITKLLFGESRRHIVPTGRSFTKEDVEAQQPDTEDYIDTKTMPSGMFAEPPSDDPPKAAGDGEPTAPSRATILVQTAEVMLKSRPKAAPAPADEPADDKGATSSQYRPQATARLEGQASGHVKAYWMEEHLPEYQYTMVTNADGDDVPGILFEGTAYELELISASDVETIASQTRVDKKFSDFATRVNKVCRGHGSCAKVPMDKDLWIDLEDFAKAFRKEVPPDVFITVSNLFGTAMKIDKHGKSRFQFLCAKISHFPVDNGLGMSVLSCENPCNSGSFRSCFENRTGSLCQFNHGVLLRPRIPRAKSRLHWRAPVCHD